MTRKFAMWMAALAVLAGSLSSAVPAFAAETYTQPLSIELSGYYNDQPDGSQRQATQGVVAGVVASGATPTDFILTARCFDRAGVQCTGETYTWDVDGGNVTFQEGGQVHVNWTQPGTYTVRVDVDLITPGTSPVYAAGSASIVAAVSPQLADAGSWTAGQSTVPGTEAIWGTLAGGLTRPCRTYVPAGKALAGAGGTAEGRWEYCPTPADRLSSSVGNPIVANGVNTFELCTQYPVACGATPTLVASIVNDGLNLECSTVACSNALKDAGVVDSQGRVAYSPSRCIDNVTTRSRQTSTGSVNETVRGAESGCATVRDLMQVLTSIYQTAVPVTSSELPKEALIANLAPNPSLEDPTAGPSWILGDSEVEDNGTAFNGGRVLLVPDNPDDIAGASFTTAVDPGQTYTASIYVKTSSAVPVTIALEDPSQPAFSGSSFGTASELTVPGQWTRVQVSGAVPVATLRVSVFVPEDSGNVRLDAAAVTSTLSAITWTAGTTPAHCAAGPQPDDTVAAAVTLFPSLSYCDTDAALTKASYASMMAKALPVSSTPVNSQEVQAGFRDAEFDFELADNWAKLMGYGIPLVGDLRCPDVAARTSNGLDPGQCINGFAAMTRTQVAQSSFPLLNQGQSSSSTLEVSLSSESSTITGANAASVAVTVTAPVYYPIGSEFQLTSSSLVCPSNLVTLGESRTARTTCTWPSPSGQLGAATASLTATSTSTAQSATGSITFNVTNTKPLVPEITIAAGEGNDPTTAVAYVVDPDGDSVRIGVRSCDPAREGGLCVTDDDPFAQTGKDRTLTSDTAAGNFKSVAQTEVGSIRIESESSGRVTLRLNPYKDPETGESTTSGSWQFVLQACDVNDSCRSRLMTNVRTPAVKVPVAVSKTVLSEGEDVTFQLQGYTPASAASALNPNMLSVTWTALPSSNDYGTLKVRELSASTWSDAEVNTAYGANALFKWVPTVDGGTWNGKFTVTQSLADGGLTSPESNVTFRNTSDPAAPQVVVVATPLEVVSKSQAVEIDASGTTYTGSGELSYTFNMGNGVIVGPQATPILEYRYPQNSQGAYTVTVTVTSPKGKQGTATDTVNVLRNLLANPTFESGVTLGWNAGNGSTVNRYQNNGSASGPENGLSVSGAGSCSVTSTGGKAVAGGNSAGGRVTVYPGANGAGSTVTLTVRQESSTGQVLATTSDSATMGSVPLTLESTARLNADAEHVEVRVASDGTGQCFTLDDAGTWTSTDEVAGSVGDLVATPGHRSISLTWAAPNVNGQYPSADDYIVEYRKDGVGSWTAVNDGVATTTAATIDGLDNGSEYEVRITPVNTAGNGKSTTTFATPAGTANQILADAVGYWDAASYSTGSQVLTNQGSAGAALNAQLGSGTGDSLADPVFLNHTGTTYVYSAAGNSLTTAPAISPAATLTLEVCAVTAVEDWSNPSTLLIGQRYPGSASGQSYGLWTATGGRFKMRLSSNGSSGASILSDPHGLAAGERVAVKAAWDASPSQVRFYTKSVTEAGAATACADTNGWTQLGNGINGGVPGSLVDNSDNGWAIAASGNATANSPSKSYAAAVAVNGTTVFNYSSANASASATSIPSATGQVVSIVRPARGEKSAVVTRPIFVSNGSEYLEVANNALLNFGSSDSFTVFGVGRSFASVESAPVNKSNGLTANPLLGYNIYVNGASQVTTRIGDGTTRIIPSQPSDNQTGKLSYNSMIVNRDNQTVYRYSNGTATATSSIAGLGSLSNSENLRLAGSVPTEFTAAAVFRRPLTEAESQVLSTYFTTR